MITAITDVRLFDGEHVHERVTVVIQDQTIHSIGASVPNDATVIDGRGHTLLPGFIDSHVHTQISELSLALNFGVTTELDMGGPGLTEQRVEIAARNDVADLRAAGNVLTTPDGHPMQLLRRSGITVDIGHGENSSQSFPISLFPQTPKQASDFVKARVREGSDYIKIMIEEGSVLGYPGLSMPSIEVMTAVVVEAHSFRKLALCHALTYAAFETAIQIGADGLTHMFMDKNADDEMIEALQGRFVIPCLCLNASIMGRSTNEFASDPRVLSNLPNAWQHTLESVIASYPDGDFETLLQSVRRLHNAGIDVLVGTDAALPMPCFGGLAHGASVHHELRLMVQAGFSAIEALKAATSVPARRFGLRDRGKVAEGSRADLVLVKGNPTVTIKDTLSITSVWRAGKIVKDATRMGNPID